MDQWGTILTPNYLVSRFASRSTNNNNTFCFVITTQPASVELGVLSPCGLLLPVTAAKMGLPVIPWTSSSCEIADDWQLLCKILGATV